MEELLGDVAGGAAAMHAGSVARGTLTAFPKPENMVGVEGDFAQNSVRIACCSFDKECIAGGG